jgi:hypothetical protein
VAKSSVITEEFKAIQTALVALEPLDETQRKFAVSMVLSRLGMSEPPKGGGGGGNGGSGGGAGGGGAPDITNMKPKEFIALKRPTTDLERLVCLAYFLTRARSTPKFKVKDITDLNEEALATPFSNPSQTASNAVKQSRMLAPAEKGQKRITVDGERLVEALPDRAAVDEARAASRRPAKKKGGRKTTKKAGG